MFHLGSQESPASHSGQMLYQPLSPTSAQVLGQIQPRSTFCLAGTGVGMRFMFLKYELLHDFFFEGNSIYESGLMASLEK